MERIKFSRNNKLVFLGRTNKTKQNDLDVNSRWPDLWMVPHEGVIHENELIRIPEYIKDIKPEVELTVLMGDSCHGLSPDEVENYIEGYTICNDITARSEWPGYSDPNFGRSGFGYKMFPTFSPVFSEYVPREEINNVDDLDMSIYLDGDLTFETSTSNFDFSIQEMVSYANKICKLEEGDLISLGGAGNHDLFIDDVDDVVCEIEGIGQLKNKVVNQRK